MGDAGFQDSLCRVRQSSSIALPSLELPTCFLTRGACALENSRSSSSPTCDFRLKSVSIPISIKKLNLVCLLSCSRRGCFLIEVHCYCSWQKAILLLRDLSDLRTTWLLNLLISPESPKCLQDRMVRNSPPFVVFA